MNHIEVGILNPEQTTVSSDMAVLAARITQHSHKIHNMQDLLDLNKKPYTDEFVQTLLELPHPLLQKLTVINMAIVGASRRFLAQITRHQNDVKFVSGSLQYSDFSGNEQFVVPYEITTMDAEHKGNAQYVDNYNTTQYLNSCCAAAHDYEEAINQGVNHDAAAYMLPQGMRNVVIISAAPYQWRHMISQRCCNRNSPEMQYVMLCIWELLYGQTDYFKECGAFCMEGGCKEGKFSCGTPLQGTPTQILDTKFKYIRGR